jgi:hypothetical protein
MTENYYIYQYTEGDYKRVKSSVVLLMIAGALVGMGSGESFSELFGTKAIATTLATTAGGAIAGFGLGFLGAHILDILSRKKI